MPQVMLFGFGGVGRTLATMLYQHGVKITAVFDSSGGVYKQGGFTASEIQRLVELPRGTLAKAPIGERTDVEKALQEADVLIDVSPPNYKDGEPSTTLYRKALERGMAVVTANKAPLALHFPLFRGRPVYYKATVMAGTPLIDLAKGIPPQKVLTIRAILNGSTNYILTRVEKDGVPFDKAVQEAKDMGILEPDPQLDLGGLDPAAKLAIFLNTLGIPTTLSQIRREPLAYLGPGTKYLAIWDGSRAEIKPVKLTPDDPLASVISIYNAAEIQTDVNNIFVKGKGAGRRETAYVIINDIMKAIEHMSK